MKSRREIERATDFVRWGALGAMIAGLTWTVSGVVDLASARGRGPEVIGLVPLEEALYGVALVGTLGGS